MTKTEKANKILLWVYEKTGGDEFEKISRIYNWERCEGYYLEKEYAFTKQIPEKTGVDDYEEFCKLILQLHDKELIFTKMSNEDNVREGYYEGFDYNLEKVFDFYDMNITKKGVEKCKELMEEKNITKEEKANKILLWIYEKIGDDEYADIPSINGNSYPNLGIDYNEFCELLIKLRKKGRIEMDYNNPEKHETFQFYNLSLTRKGIESGENLNENNMIKFNFPKSNVRLTSKSNVRLNNPFKKQKLAADKKVEKAENQKDDIIVTYCWDNETHKQKVLDFVHHLRKEEGFNSTFDRLLNQEETALDFNKMMHLAMTDYRKVIIVLSKGYKEKAEKFTGGVGDEFQLIIKDIETSHKKYILISFEGISDNITPLAFKGRHTIDLSNDDEAAWNELRSKLRDEPIIDKPPVAKTQKPIVKQKIEKIKTIKNDISQEKKFVRDLNLRKEIEKEFNLCLSYKFEDNKVIEVLLRAFDGKQYPKTNNPDKNGSYEWFKVEMLRLYHQGIEFISGLKEIQVYQDDSWDFVGKDSKISGKKVTVYEIGQINFQDIIDYNKNGDEFYIYPHFFCKFQYKGTPFENIYYLNVKKTYQTFELENKKME